jgi:signal peptidase I
MNLSSARPDSSDVTPGQREVGRPRSWLAFFLGLSIPGLGHLYAGSIRGVAGALAFSSGTAAVALWLLITPFDSVLALGAAAVLILLSNLGPASHAAWIASRGILLPMRRAGRIIAYALYLILGIGLSERVSGYIRRDFAESFRIPSVAMYPSLLIGDCFIAAKSRTRIDRIRRGDVVVFLAARDGHRILPADERSDLPRETFGKRVIGLPGDVIEIREGVLLSNGAPLERKFVGTTAEPGSGFPLDLFRESIEAVTYTIAEQRGVTPRSFPPVTVPVDRVFLLGDNRENSNDSRYWGTVHRRDIIGVASTIYFSRDPQDGLIRWERFGRSIR